MKRLIGTFILGIIFFGFTISLNAQTANSEIRRGDALANNPANNAYARLAYNEAMRIAAQNYDWHSMLALANRYLLIGDEWAAGKAFSLAFTFSYDMAIGDPNRTGIRRDCTSGRQGLLTAIEFFDDTLSEISKSVYTQNLMTFDRNQAANAVNWLNDNYGNRCPGMERFAINTTKTTYDPTESVFVNYSGMPGNNTDVVTIVETSTNKMVSWFYTAGNRQGSVRFPILPAGNYEAHLRPAAGRIEALSRFSVKQGSTSAGVPASRISVSTSKNGYSQLAADKNIGVSYSGIPDRSKYWVGIFKKGDLSRQVDYAWPESANGQIAFPMLPDGAYEVHVIEKDSRRSVASSSFTVGIRQTSAGVCRSLTQC
jgi:hypothetical protein